MSICIEGRRIDTKCTSYAEDDDFEEAHITGAIIGSRMLRDAIFRARGYFVPPQHDTFPPIIRKGAGRPYERKVRCIDPEIMRIIEATAKHYRTTVAKMIGPRGKRKLSSARHVAMYLARQLTPASYPDIAFNFGRKDHTTILHGERVIRGLIANVDAPTLTALNSIRARLGV